MDIGLHTSVITAAFPYAWYGPPELDGDGRVVGVEVLFTVTVHPVVLSGSIGKADRGDEIVIVFVDDLRDTVSRIYRAFPGWYAAVVRDAGGHLETVEQLDLILELYVIVLEVFQIQVFEVESGVFQLFVNFVHDLGRISLVGVSETEAQGSLFLRKIFPISLEFEEQLFSFEYKTDLRPETQLAVFLEGLAEAELLPVSNTVSSGIAQLERIQDAGVFQTGRFIIQIDGVGQAFCYFQVFPNVACVVGLGCSDACFFVFCFFFLGQWDVSFVFPVAAVADDRDRIR